MTGKGLLFAAAVAAVLSVAYGDLALGTNVIGAPGPDGANVVEVFARGAENSLWTNALVQHPHDAKVWEAVQWRVVEGSRLSSHPAVAAQKDGLLRVFARGRDNTLFGMAMRVPTKAHGGSDHTPSKWHKWGPVQVEGSQQQQTGEDKVLLGSRPVTGTTRDGRIVVVALNTDHAVVMTVQTAPNSNVFSAWVPVEGVTANDVPSLFNDAQGYLRMYAVGEDFFMYQSSQDFHVDKNHLAFSKFVKMQGPPDKVPFGNVAGPVHGALFSDGREELIAQTTSNNLVHRFSLVPTGARWSNWLRFATPHENHAVGGLCVLLSEHTGLLQVLGRSPSGAVTIKSQDHTRGWTPWTTMGGSVKLPPSCTLDARGNLHVLAIGADNTVVHKVLTKDGPGRFQSYPGITVA